MDENPGLPFGLLTEDINPLSLSSDEIRTLLSRYGVIAFRGMVLDHQQQVQVMSMLGKVQHWMEQQAPRSYADPNDPKIILLDNEDFLGKSRMGWHMDQTYLTGDYLPVRSLYCTQVDGENVTEFVDVAYLTDRVVDTHGLPDNTVARYYIDSARSRYSDRLVFSDCRHIGRKLLRYDNRMEFINRTDSMHFKDFCRSVLNGTDIPRFEIRWEANDFVIFDNNRCPHRRSVMNGDCRLSRLTSTCWMT